MQEADVAYKLHSRDICGYRRRTLPSTSTSSLWVQRLVNKVQLPNIDPSKGAALHSARFELTLRQVQVQKTHTVLGLYRCQFLIYESKGRIRTTTKSPSPTAFRHHTGSAAFHVGVPPAMMCNPATIPEPTCFSSPALLPGGPSYSRIAGAGGAGWSRIARNVRNHEECLERRYSSDPIRAEMVGMSSAPPMNRPNEEVVTRRVRSAAATLSSPSFPCC